MKISNAAAKAMADALTALLDAGAGAGKLRIYDGTQPADPDTAIGAQNLLAELTLNATAFAAAVDANPGGQSVANAITGDTAADATGTATWFRALDSDDNAIIDGDVSATGGGADLELNSVSIVQNAAVDVTGWNITMPES